MIEIEGSILKPKKS